MVSKLTSHRGTRRLCLHCYHSLRCSHYEVNAHCVTTSNKTCLWKLEANISLRKHTGWRTGKYSDPFSASQTYFIDELHEKQYRVLKYMNYHYFPSNCLSNNHTTKRDQPSRTLLKDVGRSNLQTLRNKEPKTLDVKDKFCNFDRNSNTNTTPKVPDP